jgi:hypothetical protein
VLRLPLCRHALEKRFRQHRPKISDVLNSDALKVAVLDIIEDSGVRGWKAGRLHIDIKQLKDGLALQGLLRQH